MPLGKFMVFSFLGSLPWTALLVFAGVQLGANWESVGAWLKRFEYAIIAVLVVIVLAWIWFRIIVARRAARASPERQAAPEPSSEVRPLD